jgi:putative oxidoreductase
MTNWVQAVDAAALSGGLLVGRLVIGLGIAAHGAQKLFGWFGGHGLVGTSGYFESLGFRPGRVFATLAGLGEFVSGVLIALGLFGPIGPALLLAVMLVAMGQNLKNGFFAMNQGVELPLLYGAAGVALALTGPGAFSLDAAFGLGELSSPDVGGIALIVGILGAIGAQLVRHPAPAAR